MLTYGGLWKRICKFCKGKFVSDGDTKENTKGKVNGVSRNSDFNLELFNKNNANQIKEFRESVLKGESVYCGPLR